MIDQMPDVTMRGTVTDFDGVAHYRICMTYSNMGVTWKDKVCSGCARYCLTHKYYIAEDDQVIAWGYEGIGPIYCSAAIINWSVTDGSIGWFKFGDTERDLTHRFHVDVVKHLPDNWDMTAYEVRQWIKDGTLPLCITNKPKEENVK